MEAVMRRGGTEEAAPFYPSSHEVVGQQRITLVFFSYLFPDFIQPHYRWSGEHYVSSSLCNVCTPRFCSFLALHVFVHIANIVICKSSNERFKR